MFVCFQVFTLPKVSAKMKLKLTAIDGSRVRRVGVAWFGSSRSEDYGESGLTVLTNQGDLHVVSLPGVKLQVQYPCIRREDVSGIASCVFTKHGQGRTRETHSLHLTSIWHFMYSALSCIIFFLLALFLPQVST
jgi:hypothetical protein